MRIIDWSSDVCSSDLRLAVESGRDEGELVARLGHGEALDVGPGIPGGALAAGDLRILEGRHLHIFRRRERARKVDQRLHRKAAVGHRHRPGLDAAEAIDPLQIGRASWRERVCQYGWISGVAGSLN